jgi:hypothetical protein
MTTLITTSHQQTITPAQIATLLSHYYIAPATGPQWHQIMHLRTLEQVAELCYERLQHEARHYTVGQPDPSYIGAEVLPEHDFCVGSGAHYDQIVEEMRACLADERPSYRVESYGPAVDWIRARRVRQATIPRIEPAAAATTTA